MNRTENYNNANQSTPHEINKKIAVHEAGHAASIHIGNRQKKLPPIFFQICIETCNNNVLPTKSFSRSEGRYIARVDGGRLIHTLPTSLEEATHNFNNEQKLKYQTAFDADIINFLVGPLAEAKYLALRDDELVNFQLVNLNSLHHYGGLTDLRVVNEYLACYSDDPECQQSKISELFTKAADFVNLPSNWCAIKRLSQYILSANKNIIECSEVIAVLEYKNQGVVVPPFAISS